MAIEAALSSFAKLGIFLSYRSIPGQVDIPTMTTSSTPGTQLADPAAVFAISHSLWQACTKRAAVDPKLNLSDHYAGMDGLMREVMRIATQFETWACQHIAFDELDDVWPYLLQDKFGECCLALLLPDSLAAFAETDCLRVALRLQLPIRLSQSLHIPIEVFAENPASRSGFAAFRIQSVRCLLEDGSISPFTSKDEPFDDDFDHPFFGLYGLDRNGAVEHIANRTTYASARDLAQKIAPGINFPSEPTSMRLSKESRDRHLHQTKALGRHGGDPVAGDRARGLRSGSKLKGES